MTFETFKQICQDTSPPAGIPPLLMALWHDAIGDWDAAHTIAQQDESRHGCRVHAYLHRKEGDRGNAGYWYGRAGLTFPVLSLAQEWDEITSQLLNIPETTIRDGE